MTQVQNSTELVRTPSSEPTTRHDSWLKKKIKERNDGLLLHYELLFSTVLIIRAGWATLKITAARKLMTQGDNNG